MRGANWNKIECFFAVWAYDQLDRDRNIVKTTLYNHVANLIGRTAKSVEYKIENVSACDPRPRELKPISEMPRYQTLLKETFDLYWPNRDQLEKLYEQYVNLLQQGFNATDLEQQLSQGKIDFFVEEGETQFSTRKVKQRSTALVDEARKFYSDNGFLYCSVCGFSVKNVVPKEIINIHHLEPIADLTGVKRMALNEALSKVRPVCPTCHSIIHSRKPPLTIDEAKQVLQIINEKTYELDAAHF